MSAKEPVSKISEHQIIQKLRQTVERDSPAFRFTYLNEYYATNKMETESVKKELRNFFFASTSLPSKNLLIDTLKIKLY